MTPEGVAAIPMTDPPATTEINEVLPFRSIFLILSPTVNVSSSEEFESEEDELLDMPEAE